MHLLVLTQYLSDDIPSSSMVISLTLPYHSPLPFPYVPFYCRLSTSFLLTTSHYSTPWKHRAINHIRSINRSNREMTTSFFLFPTLLIHLYKPCHNIDGIIFHSLSNRSPALFPILFSFSLTPVIELFSFSSSHLSRLNQHLISPPPLDGHFSFSLSFLLLPLPPPFSFLSHGTLHKLTPPPASSLVSQ